MKTYNKDDYICIPMQRKKQIYNEFIMQTKKETCVFYQYVYVFIKKLICKMLFSTDSKTLNITELILICANKRYIKNHSRVHIHALLQCNDASLINLIQFLFNPIYSLNTETIQSAQDNVRLYLMNYWTMATYTKGSRWEKL